MISTAKLCVYRSPRTNEHSFVSMQHLYVMCELWSEYKLVGIHFLLKTGTHDLHWRWGHKFAIKALLCYTQYFYRVDSDISLNNTHRMFRWTTHIECILAFPVQNGCANAPQRYVIVQYLVVRRMFLFSLALCNISSFLARSVQLDFSILLQHHIPKLSRNFCIYFPKCLRCSIIQSCAPNVAFH
jgi:hypothetical protein